jgi:hypothetical protein
MLAVALCLSAPAAAQRVAVLAPELNSVAEGFADRLAERLGTTMRVVDGGLARAAFDAIKPEAPFNMTTDESRTLGSAIGCDHFVVVRAATIPRYSLEKKEHFESFAALFTVSARSGRLADFRIVSFNGFDAWSAERLLLEAAAQTADDLATRIASVRAAESAELAKVKMTEVPTDATAPGFRSPLPFRRISPKYTAVADLYSVTATVDIEIDLSEKGMILRTEIVRWAGFGLDESVADAVRSMNWRPAENLGRFIPMRYLLRYNFRKIEKPE